MIDDDRARPLHGVRVLDLSRVLAGPFAGSILAALGADVIKVEAIAEPDTTRSIGTPLGDGLSHYFISANAGKRAIALDLKREEGRRLLLDLVRRSDVVLENFRPGVMERLGLGPDVLRAAQPRIVMVSVKSFGDHGPRRDWPAFDLIIQAMSGAMSVTGETGRPPVRLGFALGDLAGGLYAVIAALAALVRRGDARGGSDGARIEVSLEESLMALSAYLGQYVLNGEVEDPEPVGSGHPKIVPYGAFATRDGWLVVGIIGEKFWAPFCRALELVSLASDPRFRTNRDRVAHRDELEPLLADHFAGDTSARWLEALRRESVPCGPIRSLREALSDARDRKTGFVGTVEDARLPGGAVSVMRSPFVIDGARGRTGPAPAHGEQTDAILVELLGLPPEQIASLHARGIVAGGGPGTR